MKTSLAELQLLENYVSGRASGEEQILLEARLLLEPGLQEEVYWQRKTYHVIRAYGRMQLRDELEQVHRILFTAPRHQSFRDKVLGFFGM